MKLRIKALPNHENGTTHHLNTSKYMIGSTTMWKHSRRIHIITTVFILVTLGPVLRSVTNRQKNPDTPNSNSLRHKLTRGRVSGWFSRDPYD